MFFSKRLSFPDLIAWCRTLRHQLAAGVSLTKVVGQQAERGPRGVRPVAQRLSAAVQRGEALSDAFDREKDTLPPLFIALAKVGEETGHFPEIMGELEKYYSMQYSLQRQFRSQSMGPLIQLVFALLIVGVVIWILGAIGGATPIKIFGLSHFQGALTFWAFSFGLLALAWFAYRKLPGLVQGKATFDARLLKIPALGPCLEALALGRFSLCFHLTMETGMSIGRAIKLSLNATGNAALAAASDDIGRALKKGETLTLALSRCKLFPVDFIQIMAVAEEAGRVPEVMRQQADHYHEEAALRMKTLVKMASFAVWGIYAAIMVVMIFNIASVYLKHLGGGLVK